MITTSNILEKVKKNYTIAIVILTLFVTVLITSSYNKYLDNERKNYKRIINNIYFKKTIEYLAIINIGDSPESPSSIVRRVKCDDPVIHRIEGCNRQRKWREDNNLIRYFFGIADEGYSISEEKAEEILSEWRKNWANPKIDKDNL